MKANPHDRAVEALELKIAHFLRRGVLLAGAALALGWLGMLAGGDGGLKGLGVYQGQSLAAAWGAARANGQWARLLSYAGLLGLILLPLSRVVMTAVLFFRQGDRLLAAAAGFVAAALAASVALGIDL